MKKLISIMLSAALICSMVSCGKDSSDDKKNEIVPLELIKETVTETEYDGDILIYTVSYEAVRLSDVDAENYPQLAAELESIIEADAEIIGYAKENMKDQYLATGGSFSGFADEYTAEIIRADSLVISFRQDQYTYTGGAHPMYGSGGVNINSETGRRLIITDVVKDIELLKRLTEDALKEEYSDALYEDAYSILNDLTAEDFIWTMDYEGITLYFNPYMLAPFAAGMQEVTLKFADYPELFDEKYAGVPDRSHAGNNGEAMDAAVYDELIDQVYDVIAEGKTMDSELEGVFSLYAGLGHMNVSDMLSATGYAVEDINGDNIPELILGFVSELEGGKAEGNVIYTLYTLSDGKPVLVFESFARSSYRWMGGGTFYYSGSGGATNSAFGIFTLPSKAAELACEEFWFTDIKPGTDTEIGYYYNTYGSWVPEESQELSLSEEQFWEKEGEFWGKIFEQEKYIEFTQFINHENAEAIDAVDLWVETSEDSHLAAVAYLGYEEGGLAEFRKYADDMGITEKYPFISSIDEANTVLYEGGQWYLIVPDENVELVVYNAVLEETNYVVMPGEEQFTSSASDPVLIRCNVSEFYPNIMVALRRTDEQPVSYSPQLSGKDGSLVASDEIFDFTPYNLLPHYLLEVITDPEDPEYKYYTHLGEIISTPVVGNDDPEPVLIKVLKDDMVISVEMTEDNYLLAERKPETGDVLFIMTELMDDDAPLRVTASYEDVTGSWYAVTDNGNKYYREMICG